MNRPLAAAALLCLPLIASSPIGSQDGLQQELQQLRFVVKEQNQRIEAAEADLAAVHARLAELAVAGRVLSASVQESRANGFESAGANPQARTDLLEGLLGLGAELARPVRPAEDEAAQEGRVGG